MSCTYATVSESHITAYVKKFVHLYQVGLSHLISLQYHLRSLFFLWSALGDVDLHFSPNWVTKANAVKVGTTSAM
jgi:hypothetical protein